MKNYDAAVIGGGVLGCFAARNLRRWNISTVLIEAAEDVCTGITRANTAIVYAGYDNKAGSLKAQMTVRANADFGTLCDELEVPFSRCGSLMVSFGPKADQVLQKKYSQGQRNGVPGLKLLSGPKALEMEPMLAGHVSLALYSPSTGTANPWKLGIAAYENAIRNGCEPMLHTQVQNIRKTAHGYVVETNKEAIACRVILNCAGLNADKVQELLFPPSVRLFCDGADFFVLDKHAPAPKHILFHESEEKGKGITAVPTVEGNLLLGPSQRPLEGKPWATAHAGMDFLRETTQKALPYVDLNQIIRSFASVRPNPHQVIERDGEYIPDGKSIGSFVIENPAFGFYSLMGIKTPGLTCANELGRYLAQKAAACLDARENPAFDPCRQASLEHAEQPDPCKNEPDHCKNEPDHCQIICQCESITKGEILEAIKRGASTVDGVKRRAGSGMGRCQGSRCTWEIEKLLEEYRHGSF